MAEARASLDLTHVIYDASSDTSFVLALLTLSPILLMPAYAVLAVQTRELTIINMWAGQLLSEGLNLVLKHAIKQERPAGNNLHLNGYGFPSSHSQYMGFFATFLICHLYYRHRFASTGSPLVDQLWRLFVYTALIAWAVIVAYSRLHLLYHTPHQVYWGFGIGVGLGLLQYIVTELLPIQRPHSTFGKARAAVLTNPISTWLEIRDGWAVWPDGGREAEWKRWQTEFVDERARLLGKRSD
ncbi:PAP2-domain-containing protein [Leucogyrophana mollusca]|uniref:PAP2-domain-containing protein n=1 Tax=Leucogyrophana mollusca TaxID=85980 RepID=A0ACB8B6D6_9AGAM|nr:PAP2-domain-containing protein [Leucogyrophana mollusca]